ncbi:MAG: inositol monophosphatase family protein [Pseudomonadota bacterium]
MPELTAVAHALADAAGEAILPLFRTGGLMTEDKSGDGPAEFDPVTLADRSAEEAMRSVLAERRPDDAILGEEFGRQSGSTGLTWILDPIDGTRGFVAGTPNWGVLIAVAAEDGPLLGLIAQPYIGERFFGAGGFAEFSRGKTRLPMKTRSTRSLADCILFTTFPEVGTEAEGRAFRALAPKTKLVRYGMDCYAYALLAAGQIDLVVEAGLEAYDIMAPVAVIEAAGGVVTDWSGAPAHNGGRALAASSAAVHAAALEVLQGSMGR